MSGAVAVLGFLPIALVTAVQLLDHGVVNVRSESLLYGYQIRFMTIRA